MNKHVIIYIGGNNPLLFKRGVEQVILYQSKMLLCGTKKYYLYNIFSYDSIGDSPIIWEDIICYGTKRNIFQIRKLNAIIKKIMTDERTDVVFIHSHNAFVTAFLHYDTDVLTIHDGPFYQRTSSGYPVRGVFHGLIEKIAYFRSKKIHFISEFAKKKSLYKSDKKSCIIYNTTALEKYLLRNKLNIVPSLYQGNYLIFTVRGIQGRTRIDLLVALAKVLKEKKIEINGKKPIVMVAGKGNLLDVLKKQICEEKLSDYIVLLGYISDDEVVNFYQKSDIVIVTAEFAEGFGLPVIEGYCAGKPVIASNVCAIPEIIYDKKFLFNNNVDDIIDKIFYASSLENNDNTYFKYYQKRFSSDVIKNQYKNSIYIDF